MGNPRLLAYNALRELENKHSDELVSEYIEKYSMSDVDRRFFMQLVMGVVENRILLDYYIDQLAKMPPSAEVREVLRLGLYQLTKMRVPAYAAVEESVNLVARVGQTKAKGFVNALLRNFIRRKQRVPMPKEYARLMSVLYSYPLWLVEYWTDRFGKERTEALLRAGNAVAPLTIRVNSRRELWDIDSAKEVACGRANAGARPRGEKSDAAEARDFYLTLLERAGVKAVRTEQSEQGIVIENLGGKRIQELPRFNKGAFIVQDESSQLAVLERLPGADDICVDVCCSPGGKTVHLAEYAKKVYAFDVSRTRLGLAMQNFVRMQVQEVVEPDVVDATKGREDLFGKADYVLVDAPCSALGTIRRNPDIKYNRIEGDVKKNAAMQREVLARSAEYVRDGGVLLYSTCTITEEENEGQVRAFLAENPDFRLLAERQLLPSEGGTDGFYYALMERK